MTTTEMGRERVSELTSLRAELIKEAAGRPQDPRKHVVPTLRVDRKWWEFFCVANA